MGASRKKHSKIVEEPLELDLEIDLDEPPKPSSKPESLFAGMGETRSEGSADTRDAKQQPLFENMEVFSVSKQRVAKDLMTSVLGTLVRLVTGDVSACCNLPPGYADKLGMIPKSQ